MATTNRIESEVLFRFTPGQRKQAIREACRTVKESGSIPKEWCAQTRIARPGVMSGPRPRR
jgi:hypothetical protein